MLRKRNGRTWKRISVIKNLRFLMRKSGTTPKLNLSIPDLSNLHQIYNNFLDLFQQLVPQLKMQMELLEQIETSSQNQSLLFKIIQQIQAFNSDYLKTSIGNIDLDQILSKISNKGEIEIREGMIFSKKGGLKTETKVILKQEIKQRRMSFAAMKYADADRLLSKDSLKEMLDLDILCSLNGYRLPYYNEKEGRGMYESFFDIYLKEILDNAPQNSKRNLFLLLQEIIYIIHIFTEFLISLLEVFFEIINLIKTRIKGAELTIDLKLNLKEMTSIEWENLIACFTDSEKLFLSFRTRKLIRTISDVELGNVSWITKLESYDHALSDALDLYKMNCETFIQKINDLKVENEEDVQVRALLNDIYILIDEIRAFILSLANPKKTYLKFLNYGKELLQIFDQLEIQHPIKYGLTPRTNRNRIFNRSLGSSTSSPRSDTESPRNEKK